MNSNATTFTTALAAPAVRSLTASMLALARRLVGPTPRPPGRDPVREAAAVRALADSIRQTDPRFAADLCAAADRHEQLHATC
jgi:hypothetical protein